MAAISNSPRSATAVARSACRVIAPDDKQFYSALQKKPEFALMMLGTLIQLLRGMITQIWGVPNAQTRESRVFDKKLLASLQTGLGDQAQALVRYDEGNIIMVAGQTGVLMYIVLDGAWRSRSAARWTTRRAGRRVRRDGARRTRSPRPSSP